MKYCNMTDRDLLDAHQRAIKEAARLQEAKTHHSFYSSKQGGVNVGKPRESLEEIRREMERRGLKPR